MIYLTNFLLFFIFITIIILILMINSWRFEKRSAHLIIGAAFYLIGIYSTEDL
jgi:Na+/H+ antiporter NhaD/arsenite permease-like protein